MDKLSILAPAKINLYLDVLGRRADGYHNIESVMQTVTMFDHLSVTRLDAAEEAHVNVHCLGFSVPEGAANTVFRAAEAFFAAVGISAYDVSFELDKKIPAEAGLGGGSADAAAAILALNRLYETSLSMEQMCEIGAKIGADVPFCLEKGTACIRGIGEILTSCAPLSDCAFLLVLPKENHISTAEAYRQIDDAKIPPHGTPDEFVSALLTCDPEQIAAHLFNAFEAVTPEACGVEAMREMLLQNGALGARMSGSGPSVFGLFRTLKEARAAKEQIGDDFDTYVCTPARRDDLYFEI